MANWTLKEKSTGELAVTIDGEKWKNAVEKSFQKLASKVTVEGFRKGKAPRNVLEKRISKSDRMIQAIEDHMNEWLFEAIEEAKVEPISRPQVDIRSFDEDKAEIVYHFAVMPEVKLGQYTGVDYEVEETSVSDEELDKELNRIIETYADMEVKDGPIESGDIANIDYEGFKDGVPFDGGKAEGYDLTIGSGSFIPGFEEQLIGAKAGEEKELSLKFPENYHAEELKGADVIFKVKVNEVKKKVLPTLDDDFAKDVNMPGVETAEQLKEKVRERLLENKTRSVENVADTKFLEVIADNSEVDIPDVLVQEEQQNRFNELASSIQQYGMKVDQYLKMMGQTAEDFMKSIEDDSRKAVKLRMVLSEIAKQEKIEPTAEEIEEEFKKIAERYRMEVADVKAAIQEDLLKMDLRNSKALEFIKEKANKKVVKPTSEEK